MTPEQRAARIWHHEMETCEGIHEHAVRIASLEELVLDLWQVMDVFACGSDESGFDCANWQVCGFYKNVGKVNGRNLVTCSIWHRMRELGIEVGG